MDGKLFTLPLDAQWRKQIEEHYFFRKACKGTIKGKEPWQIPSVIHILAHEQTEEALKRLIRASQNGLPVDLFCEILLGCHHYLVFAGYKKNKTFIPWMRDRKGFKRLAAESRENKMKLSRFIDELIPHGPMKNKPREEMEMISMFAEADGLEERRPRFTDVEILDALETVAKFWDLFSKPRTAHRPKDEDLHFLLTRLEFKFRENFSKPLYPTIALLAQVVSDVRQSTNGENRTDRWTTRRTIKLLQRIHQSRGFHKLPALKS